MNYGNPYYNSMPQYPYGYQQQMQQRGQMASMPMQQPQVQPMVQPMQFQVEPPIREIKFVTSEEAKAYIVMPNSTSLLIDKQQGMAYLKSADMMGQSLMEAYSFNRYAPEGQNKAQEGSEAPQPIDLSPFITNEQLEGKNYATKSDLEKLALKIDELNKKMILKSNTPTPVVQKA